MQDRPYGSSNLGGLGSLGIDDTPDAERAASTGVDGWSAVTGARTSGRPNLSAPITVLYPPWHTIDIHRREKERVRYVLLDMDIGW